jgi:hypothetical protein
MKPRVRIATARTPDGGEMVLFQHGRDFSITINGQDLMHIVANMRWKKISLRKKLEV